MMYKIDFPSFICYYLIGAALVIIFDAMMKRPWIMSRPVFKKEHVWQCAICTHVYFEPKSVKLSTCPVCASINQRVLPQEGALP